MVLSYEEFEKFTPSKPTYALFGYPLSHSMSPQLHTALFQTDKTDAEYIGISVPPEKLEDALKLAKEKLCGINVTIPHKFNIMQFLDEVDEDAKHLNAVNTISFTEGKSKGYNTDILGFSSSFELDDVKLSDKKVLILGYGGASGVMAYHCAKSGAHVTITGRNNQKAFELVKYIKKTMPHAKISSCDRRKIPKDIQIVVNGTPLGMFPHENSCPLRFLPKRTEYVFDAIYNPPITSTMKLANKKKTKVRDGLYMLVMQAAHAQTIWTGRTFTDDSCDKILKQLYAQMAVKRLNEKYKKHNLVLCGFMGSGKTTAGKKLAKILGLYFVDADRYIEEQEGKTISEIFAEHDEQYFRDLETRYVRVLSKEHGMLIALGGGSVLRPENVEAIKKNGLIIHLDTPYYRIVKNLTNSVNRPLLAKPDKNDQMRKLYNTRKSIYHNAADISVRSPRLSELIDRIIKSI